MIIIVDILRRFEICRNHGDFQQCFNLGKLPGGFGSATGLHNSSLVQKTKSTPKGDRTHSGTKRRYRSPDTVAHRQPSNAQALISEFIALSASKKQLETMFTDKESDDEDTEQTKQKEMRNKMMRICEKRRQAIADTIDDHK